MKLIVFLTLILVVSCSRDERLVKYNGIIDNADSIKVFLKTDTSMALKKVAAVTSDQETKEILKRGIKPGLQMKFLPYSKIEIYEGGKMTGVLLVLSSDKSRFVNFQNEGFGFGFEMPYGLGMYLDEIR